MPAVLLRVQVLYEACKRPRQLLRMFGFVQTRNKHDIKLRDDLHFGKVTEGGSAEVPRTTEGKTTSLEIRSRNNR